jgi:Carboxypeptidase regulatory-like domain
MQRLLQVACLALLVSCSGPPTIDTRQNENQTATIEGTVRELDTETPIAGASLFLVRTSDQPQVRTTTDADGHFVLEGLDAGRHLVALVREGYVVPGRQEISGYPFRVTTGQHIANTNFHMVPTATIGGRIFHADGSPANRVEVQLLQNLYVMGRQQWSLVNTGGNARNTRVFTNERGEFRVLGVDPGRYRIRFVPRELTVDSVVPGGVSPAPMLYPGVRDISKATSVDAKPGRETLLEDMTLTDERRGWIRVIVINESGESLEGFGSWRIGPPGWVGPEYILAEDQVVNDYHQFQPDSPGPYDIVGMWSTLKGRLAGTVRVNYRGADVDVRMFVRKPQAKFTGHVMMVQNKDAAKNPLEGVEVAIGPAISYFARSGPDGALLLQEVYPGRYQLGYIRGLPSDTFVLSVNQGPRDAFREGVVLGTGAASVDVLVSAGAGVLQGKVINGGRHPVHNALVALIPESPLKDRTDYYGAYRDARTDQNGEFEFRGLTPGSYRAYAWTDAPASAYRNDAFMKPLAGKGTLVKLNLGGRENVELNVLDAEP